MLNMKSIALIEALRNQIAEFGMFEQQTFRDLTIRLLFLLATGVLNIHGSLGPGRNRNGQPCLRLYRAKAATGPARVTIMWLTYSVRCLGTGQSGHGPSLFIMWLTYI